MKSLVTTVLFATLLLGTLLPGQTPPPPKLAPGTVAPAQPLPTPAPAAPIKPDTVVIEVDGKTYTAAEVDKMIGGLPPQYQPVARAQPQFLTQLFVMKRMAADAEKDGLDQQAPFKEQIELNRMQLLASAQMTAQANSMIVDSDEQQKYYNANPDRFKQAKVRVIYIAFSPSPDKTGADGKKLATEAEAKAKVDDLRKQILAGADFGKLAREHSEDKSSAAKDGDFGMIKHNSSYPEPLKAAIFAMKAGDVSQPVKQPNGFYLIRVDELTVQPFNEVSVDIFQELRNQRIAQWNKSIQEQYKVKVVNPAYFTPAPAQLQQVR